MCPVGAGKAPSFALDAWTTEAPVTDETSDRGKSLQTFRLRLATAPLAAPHAAALAVPGASAGGAGSGALPSRRLNVCKLLPRSEVSSVTGASVVHASSAKLGAFPAP